MSELNIVNLSKRFDNTAVFENINLSVREKEFLVLLGPSGCGKSTLLNIIAGLESPTSGRIEIDGKDVIGLEPKDRGLSMVFQSYALYPTMTVRGNMSFGLQVAGLKRSEIERKVEKAATMLHLTELLDRKPSQLSGGQRQRAAIGRALVRDVSLFLFDEPLSNLDAKLRSQMRGEIRRLHDTLGVTSIYVTHDQVEAMTMASSIVVLKGGVIQQHAEPQTLYDEPENLFVAGFIGASPMNILKGRIAIEAGRPVAACTGFQVDLSRYRFKAPPVAGQEIALGVRPENVCFGEAGGTSNTGVMARIDYVEPLGADTLVWTKVGDEAMSLRVDPREARLDRQTVPLHFDLDRLSVFSRETERRL
ncbi:ABC transporter ATP-binding protein [Propionivibrio soli]|uniref:ABC transporter ATP-binding protein n=1 Tax=Propionivibrio soli TaxID=2976531 RepID=UPI0021E93CC4|nr:ABC transporter ATP-binding protein [Propionivibrio soli]